MSDGKTGGIGFLGAVSIGVGGMVGGGIFAVLGLAVQLARGGTPLAFLIAGAVAMLTAYSYAKLSVALPSRGGTVVFLDRAFGVDLFTGSINLLLWLSYVVMLALYAHAFGSYGATFFAGSDPKVTEHVLMSAAILLPTLLNMLSAGVIGRAESLIVAIKIALLVLFVAVGIGGVEPHRLAPQTWSPAVGLATGGMIIFVAFEGFELIANAARDVRDPTRTLPRALYASVAFVILLYLLVSTVTVGTLPLERIAAARDYALAEAARPVLGTVGFKLIAIAALLSTISAINATLYGASRLSFSIAKEGELPGALEREAWGRPVEGLIITSVLAMALANIADLSAISIMGSAGFLVVFGAVNAACVILARKIGAKRWLAGLGGVACGLSTVALIWHAVRVSPGTLWVLAAMFGLSIAVEVAYRVLGRRPFSLDGSAGTPAQRRPPSG